MNPVVTIWKPELIIHALPSGLTVAVKSTPADPASAQPKPRA